MTLDDGPLNGPLEAGVTGPVVDHGQVPAVHQGVGQPAPRVPGVGVPGAGRVGKGGIVPGLG